MDNKSKIVIIVVVVLVIIAMVLLFVHVSNGGSLGTEDILGKTEELPKPIIELSLDSEKYTSGSVVINIEAYMLDGTEIEAIVLPNSQEVISSSTKYEVSKNGDYEFLVKSKNGETTSKTITINNILDSSPDVPYIPQGFEHVENTTVQDGYTIIDKNGNEFVWIPVETGMLYRETEGNVQYEENVNEINEFSNSVLRYYGFYVAKYEASETVKDGKETIACIKDVIPLSNINYKNAYEKSQKMCDIYKYEDTKTALMNSYAWDTTLKWINKGINNYSSNVSYGNYSGTILPTGNTENDVAKNICDLSGNLREWTTEEYYATSEVEITEEDTIYRVIRGGSANIQKVAGSHAVYPDTMTDTYWGFRVILYKK